MALIACPVVEKQKSHDLINAFIAGAPADVFGYVFAGVKDSNWHKWDHVKKHKLPFYYIDNSYFDQTRATHFRVTKNGFQVDAMAHEYTGERFDALNIEVKSMRVQDLDLPSLYVKQSALHMMLVEDSRWWLRFTVEERAIDGSGLPAPIIREWRADKAKQQATLQDDLNRCSRVVTHSSAAAVMALLEGLPILVSKVSAVHSVEVSGDGSIDNRYRAMSVLAEHQFTLPEIKDGLAWQTVK